MHEKLQKIKKRSHSTQVRWGQKQKRKERRKNNTFTFHTGQMRTWVAVFVKCVACVVHIPHRSDEDDNYILTYIHNEISSHSTQVRWGRLSMSPKTTNSRRSHSTQVRWGLQTTAAGTGRAAKFTFHTGQMRTSAILKGLFIPEESSHSTQVRWGLARGCWVQRRRIEFTFHTGQMRTQKRGIKRKSALDVHIPHRSDEDRKCHVLPFSLDQSSHSTQVRWGLNSRWRISNRRFRSHSTQVRWGRAFTHKPAS